jgi:dihydrofolate synthase/folylpolyglutamate synthase
LRSGRIAISENAIIRGLANVDWPARFQRWDERTVIDGGHNPAGAQALAEAWREQFESDRATIILAVLRDKDIAGIWRALAPIAKRVILPYIRAERALAPPDIVLHLLAITPTLQYSIAPSFADALETARAMSERILITGSLHFAGEALAALDGNLDALEDCAQ